MGNQLYDENKRLKEEVSQLREALDRREARDALPKMLESCAWAFFQGKAEFHISVCGQPTYGIRFLVDAPPAPPRQPTDAS